MIFSDFQLAKTSTMEFYDWNGQRLGAVSGSIFRPPVFQSTGPSMIIRFYANGGSALGYRALVSFLHATSASDVALHPNTNCGGVVENIGGAITMMKMLNNANESRIYDCVWLIKPPNTYAHLKTHLSLKVDTFEKLGPHSMLTIIQGTTSDGTVLSVTKADSALVRKDLVVPLTSGFYVHLRASFGHLSRLALVYSGFSYLGKWSDRMHSSHIFDTSYRSRLLHGNRISVPKSKVHPDTAALRRVRPLRRQQ